MSPDRVLTFTLNFKVIGNEIDVKILIPINKLTEYAKDQVVITYT